MFYVGVVENRLDPLKLGRCQVRVVGVHTDDKSQLPTSALPWAHPMQPITSAAISGIGHTPVGPVEGTWVMVIFRDQDNQMPVMLGSIGGIPQSKAAEKNSIDGKVTTGDENFNPDIAKDLVGGMSSVLSSVFGSLLGGKLGSIVNGVLGSLGISLNGAKPTIPIETVGGDKDGEETVTPPKIEPTAKAIAPDAQATDGNPAAATTVTLNTDIPTKPPAKYASNSSKQEECIKAIISACDKVGLTHKYAKCSILGICGGESTWLPLEEGHNYSAESLLKVFPGVFKGDSAKAQQYARWKGTKAEFFMEIYSPTYRNGQAVGNKEKDDGSKYYGRGFNQITGRALYEQLSKEVQKYGGGDIAKNPDLLISDVNTSALATVCFYKLNVKHDMGSPGYFEAALKRTGNPVGASYEKKKIMYQYFLGEGVLPESTNKTAANDQRTYTEQEVKYLPKNKRDQLLEDRSGNASTGFLDPNGKYPLRNLLDEPDTNRLSRGIIKETAIEFKDSTRTTGVGTANDADGTWEQPIAPFGGQYPFNKVYESESGHVMTFDDTPGHENIGLYHRKGSFIDVDANGTMVQKIIGDGYVIMDRNGFITIAGKCNVNIGGDANIMVNGSADVEVIGATNANFHNVVNLGCAKDVNWAIGGDLNIKVDGAFNTTATGNISSITAGTLQLQAAKDASLKSDGNTKLDSKGAVQLKSGGAIKAESKSEYTVKAGGVMKLTAGAASHIRATGNVNIDGSNVKVMNGAAQTAGGAEGAGDVTKLTISAPAAQASANTQFGVLVAPVRPSPEVILKTDLSSKLDADLEDFKKNPNKYYNPEAEAAGVNPQRPPQPDIGDAGQSLRSGADAADLEAFLKRQYVLGKEGHWKETGMSGGASNPNILAMWKDLGLGNIGKTDQVAWCAAFVNWTLKQCNYRYVQSARAFDLRDKPSRWNATKVTGDPQPGDIVVWSYSHVNFVYEVKSNGNIVCIGGNQGGGKVSDNNPSGGSVTLSYPNGVSPSNSSIVGIYRPSKT